MESFSLVFIFLANSIDAVDDSDQFESDIGNVFDANANEKDGNSAVSAHVILIIVVAVLVSICLIFVICCSQLRRRKLLSQQQETELGASIKSFAYSDDGNEVLNLKDNQIKLTPSKHHVLFLYFL